jgi:hypothetical protein
MLKTAIAALVIAACTSPALAQKGKDAQLISEAKRSVADLFKDPDSVRFCDIGIYQRYNSDQRFLCGEVNAKNSYGAYVGYKTFYATKGDVYVISDEDDRMDWINYREYCHKKISSVK